MKFTEVFKAMKNGSKAKLPSWVGIGIGMLKRKQS
jgi:hypothetical protein